MKMDDDAVLVLQGRYASPSDDCSASAYRRICSGEIRHIFQIVDVTSAVDFGNTNIGHAQGIYRKGIGFAVEFKVPLPQLNPTPAAALPPEKVTVASEAFSAIAPPEEAKIAVAATSAKSVRFMLILHIRSNESLYTPGSN
jgi:hypothetical protein